MRVTQKDLQQLAIAMAHNFELEPALVCAVCERESGWNQYAWNPEPAWRYFWDVKLKKPFRRPSPEELASERPPADFHSLAGDPDQEWWGQQISWGVMQVMGGVGREQGFSGLYLPELIEPLVNIPQGCKKLKQVIARNGGDREAGLLAYNGGGDPSYPAKVMLLFNKYKNLGV